MARLQEMYVSNLKNIEELHSSILKILRSIGVKHTYKKCSFSKRAHTNKRITPVTSVFKRPLDHLNSETVNLECGGTVEVPRFLAEACTHIKQNCDVEGLFRKAGSAARQREIKASIENGKKLGPQHHVVDVANILKLFLRELPDPLLPYYYHDLFLRCLLLKDKKVEGIMLTCLLLPTCHLNTLAFLMEFLQKVANHADTNKMVISNLAVVITPAVMPVEMAFNNTTRLNHHITVVEHLICNAEKIGVLPESVAEKVSNAGLFLTTNDEVEKNESDTSRTKKKKKRRSGSLTRMLNGFKKMVGKGSPDVDENCLIPPTPGFSTPCMKSAKKRKAMEPTTAFSSKKKREILKSLPQCVTLANAPSTTPCQPQPGAALFSELYLTPKVCAHPNPSWKSKSPPSKQKPRRFFASKPTSENKLTADSRLKKSRLSISSRKLGKKQKHSEDLVVTNQVASDTSCHSDGAGRSSLDWRWSSGPWSRKKRPESPLTSDADTSVSFRAFPFEAEVDLSDNIVSLDNTDSAEFVRIPKSEYEAIKSRVSAIENKISEEFGNIVSHSENVGEENSAIDLASNDEETSNTEKVQSAYEKTLEESVRFDDGSTDQLAKRLSKSLKIRHSGDNKVIRSPSARKIGTIRRRSKESAKPAQSKSPRTHVSRNMSWHLSMRPDLSHIVGHGEHFYHKSLRRGKPNTIHTGLPQPSPMRIVSPADIMQNTRIHLTFEHDQLPKSHSHIQRGKSSSCSDITYSMGNQSSTDEENTSENYGIDLAELYPLPDGPMTRSQVRRASSFHGSELAAMNKKLPKDVRKCVSYMNIYQPDFSIFEASPKVDSNLTEQQRTEHWQNAEGYFNTQSVPDQAPVTGRESVAKLRSQNAGMVLERMRLFDGKINHGSKQASDSCQSCLKTVEKHDTNKPKDVFARNPIPAQSLRIQCMQDTFHRERLATQSLAHRQECSLTSRLVQSRETPNKPTIEVYNISPEIVRGSLKKIGSPRKRYQSPKGSQKKHKLQLVKSSPKVEAGCIDPFVLQKNLKKSSSLRGYPSNPPAPSKVNITAPAECFVSGKENAKSPIKPLHTNTQSQMRGSSKKLEGENKRQFSPQILLPANLKETIYDVCTPKLSKVQKMPVSPLKDCNRIDVNTPISQLDMSRFTITPMLSTNLYRTPRETPYIKKPLIVKSPMQFGRTPQNLMLSADRNSRRLVTPLRAMPTLTTAESPLASPRRQSPRLLAMKSRNFTLKS